MIILGIDPGTAVMGYGIIESRDDRQSLVEFGAINVSPKLGTGDRLSRLYEEILKIIRRHHPDMVAVEQPFISKNVRSAMAIGRAQAIALLAAARCAVPAYEYTPAQVKQQVANYGASGKEQIQEMVRLLLGLEEIPQPNDAADALAVALCHSQQIRFSDIVSGGGKGH